MIFTMDYKLLLQAIGVALGLLYLWLEYRANIYLWIVGLIMPVVHGVLYFKSGLYADCSMQVYYVLAGLYGLAVWHRRSSDAKKNVSDAKKSAAADIAPTPVRLIAPLAAVYAAAHVAIYFFLVRFTDSSVPFWDSMTTAMSIVAMWMLSRKYIEQWGVWLVVDVITAALYVYKGIPLTAALYALYSVLAIVGYVRWRRIYRGVAH